MGSVLKLLWVLVVLQAVPARSKLSVLSQVRFQPSYGRLGELTGTSARRASGGMNWSLANLRPDPWIAQDPATSVTESNACGLRVQEGSIADRYVSLLNLFREPRMVLQ